MAKLRPRARIIRTIGDQLISGPEAALIELVKNSYDADSPFVLIRIQPQDPSTGQGGEITVEDQGHGMSPDDVINKWFEPATDEKLRRSISPGGRSMLGAKGIGRFAASRLGRISTLVSVHKVSETDKTMTTVTVDWDMFSSHQYLDDIDIPVSSAVLPSTSLLQSGVKLTISSLRDPWTKKRVETLVRELRRLASPVDTRESDFKIRLDVSAFTVERHGFDGQTLLQTLNLGADVEDSDEIDPLLIQPFTLDQHADYVLQGDFNEQGGFEGEFINYRGDQTKQRISIPESVLSQDEDHCGPFRIRVNIYDREQEAIEALFGRMNIDFHKIGIRAARKIINDNSGISIFRKGFRIRPYGDPENDWLELESKRVQDPSKKLGLSQVSGAIKIGDEDASGLIERSSREGLEHSGSFVRLKSLLNAVLSHAEERRFLFREKAGLSRRPKANIEKVRETANLQNILGAVKALPKKFRNGVIEAIQKDAAELKIGLNEIDEYQQLLQSRSALGLVVAEVLHDGRRLLNPVVNSAKSLFDGRDWLKEESKRGEVYRRQYPEHAQTIFTGVRNLGVLFKKLDPISGRKRGAPKTFSVGSVINRSLGLFSDALQRNSIFSNVECPNGLDAYGYDDDLQAALMNIIDNAVFWLSTSKESRELRIACQQNHEWVSIRVSNTGPLIDEAYIPRLFDAGFTLRAEGTGIGMVIAREAMRRSKGELYFDEDAPDTTFVIRIPYEKQKS